MVEALEDPYSAYLSPRSTSQACRACRGQFEGIGAEIGDASRPTATTSDCATLGPDCRLIVVAPLEGSPAEKAGLLAGRRRSSRSTASRSTG